MACTYPAAPARYEPSPAPGAAAATSAPSAASRMATTPVSPPALSPPPHFLNSTVVSCLPRNESFPYRTKQARSCTAAPAAALHSEDSLETADLTQPPHTAAGRSDRHWYTPTSCPGEV
uniref:Uncharacterized protein n=1 Tax=Zea mays TaxID=4577 RepID=C4J5W8_MAIZE|nr:unknown [Zea mays]